MEHNEKLRKSNLPLLLSKVSVIIAVLSLSFSLYTHKITEKAVKPFRQPILFFEDEKVWLEQGENDTIKFNLVFKIKNMGHGIATKIRTRVYATLERAEEPVRIVVDKRWANDIFPEMRLPIKLDLSVPIKKFTSKGKSLEFVGYPEEREFHFLFKVDYVDIENEEELQQEFWLGYASGNSNVFHLSEEAKQALLRKLKEVT